MYPPILLCITHIQDVSMGCPSSLPDINKSNNIDPYSEQRKTLIQKNTLAKNKVAEIDSPVIRFVDKFKKPLDK